MPAMKQFVPALVLGLTLSHPLAAQPTPALTPADSVTAVVQEFFRAMQARDSAGLRSTITPDATAWAITSGSNKTPAARPLSDFPADLVRGDRRLLERMWTPTVLVHRETAVVWTPYDFHVNGTFSHCGVDAFSLVRGEGRWRIAAITYTVERQGCAPSPLGVPR